MKTLDDALSVAMEIPHGRYRVARDPYALISNEGGCARLDGYYEPSELRRIADHLDPQPDSSPVALDGHVLVPELMTDEMAEYLDTYLSAMISAQEAWAGTLKLSPPAPLRTEADVRAEALKDWPKFCEILGVDPSLSMGQVAAHVYGKAANIRAEARREALAGAEAQHLANREGYEAFCRAIGMEPDCYDAIAHEVNARVARVRREALEEAAKVCVGVASSVSAGIRANQMPMDNPAPLVEATLLDCADNIRSLIEKVPANG